MIILKSNNNNDNNNNNYKATSSMDRTQEYRPNSAMFGGSVAQEGIIILLLPTYNACVIRNYTWEIIAHKLSKFYKHLIHFSHVMRLL